VGGSIAQARAKKDETRKFRILPSQSQKTAPIRGFPERIHWAGNCDRSILTLFVVMQATGKIRWREKFAAQLPRPAINPLESQAAPSKITVCRDWL